MADRIVLVGCGGIGSQLLPPLVRYLANRPEPRSLLVLVDGDVFEPGNRSRQACSQRDLGSNKAEALARVARDDGLACQAIPEFLDETNVRSIVREGDVILLAVDNHRARALVDRHLGSLDDATLISGGNDETDGNVQLVRRRDGWSVDGHLTEIHPEIGMAVESDIMPGAGCAVLAAERPQLVVTGVVTIVTNAIDQPGSARDGDLPGTHRAGDWAIGKTTLLMHWRRLQRHAGDAVVLTMAYPLKPDQFLSSLVVAIEAELATDWSGRLDLEVGLDLGVADARLRRPARSRDQELRATMRRFVDQRGGHGRAVIVFVDDIDLVSGPGDVLLQLRASALELYAGGVVVAFVVAASSSLFAEVQSAHEPLVRLSNR